MEAGVRRHPKAAQKAVYADPAFRDQFRHDLKNPTGFGNWDRIGVHAVKNPALKQLEGQSSPRSPRSRARTASTPSSTSRWPTISNANSPWPSFNTREDRMRELLNNKSILMALGDGGAHVDMLCDAGYPTYLLGTWVREKQALTLEEGVRS